MDMSGEQIKRRKRSHTPRKVNAKKKKSESVVISVRIEKILVYYNLLKLDFSILPPLSGFIRKHCVSWFVFCASL